MALTCVASPPVSTGVATDTHIAALDVGKVSKIPITAATIIPISTGCKSVASAIPVPSCDMSQENGQDIYAPASVASRDVSGTSRMSSLVFPAISEDISMAVSAVTYALIGLPGEPAATFAPTAEITASAPSPAQVMNTSAHAPTKPATIAENTTSPGAFSLLPIPAPMPAPIITEAKDPSRVRKLPKALSPIKLPKVLTMVPAIRVTKSPCAMPVKASINHLLGSPFKAGKPLSFQKVCARAFNAAFLSCGASACSSV